MLKVQTDCPANEMPNLGCPELNIGATKWVFLAFVIGTSVVNGHLIL